MAKKKRVFLDSSKFDWFNFMFALIWLGLLIVIIFFSTQLVGLIKDEQERYKALLNFGAILASISLAMFLNYVNKTRKD